MKFSILTATYNRAKCLPKLYESLIKNKSNNYTTPYSEWIKEYIDYSNTYIESSFKDNPSDAQRRAIEPYRSRFRTVEKIVKEWNY